MPDVGARLAVATGGHADSEKRKNGPKYVPFKQSP